MFRAGRHKPQMQHIKRAYRESRFGQLHYHIARPEGTPTAPPLLCLHQTPSNSTGWLPLIPPLAKDRIVIAPDTPGYGMSDAPPEPASIPDFAEIMADFMAGLAADGVIPDGAYDVMGAHTGSITATELGLIEPSQVRRLVLFGLAAYPAGIRAAKLVDLPVKFPPPDMSLAHVERLWAIFGQLSDDRMNAEARHVAMAECLRLGVRMPWGYIAVYNYDFEGGLDALSQPVLVVNPEDDLWEVTRRNSGRLRNGERWDLPGRAHGFLAHEADMVAARIADFLA